MRAVQRVLLLPRGLAWTRLNLGDLACRIAFWPRTLGISPYTVQGHLKAIFNQTGLRSRRELMSHLLGQFAP